ncbi:poly-gamma-glutamate hydrolase family protein [Actinacidiphila sp. ITFR-21]|uniref:poly-gamma-glutamate hydrolase family protein n=1 Tax=Actinacidiphila sp. ITFR-21 TaxID=3075199 RepID=UPI00288AB341|nr:poly-gamma-glutamate hydrolase family protein [Streptomyces sp. ITFR-21]WNI17611.1 poly-gamma-glutamate hydrolase family protein [Streptomyces sp. ITFR-21]WNI17751.1 poly-gamma-glutamate hydrolase family protein [Streptomyces sp. ITFR-21]
MAYPNFRALAAANTLGIDYDIKNRYGTRVYLLHAAIHGGGIEAPTSQLAAYAAGDEGAWYSFEARSDLTAPSLALPSTGFDEPFCVVNTGNSSRTVVWHGVDDQRESEQVAYISGLDSVLISLIVQELEAAGFQTDRAPISFAGDDVQNICNRNKARAGVQLDLSLSLRKSFYAGGDLSSSAVSQPDNRQPAFFAFGDAVRRACALMPVDSITDDVASVAVQPYTPVDQAVSTAMRVPFAIDHSGGVAATTDAREQLLDRVHALVGTLPGERVMRATYGVPTSTALFAVNADVANDQLQRAVLDAVAEFEPSAVVSAIVADVNEALGAVNINVQVGRADVPGAERDNTRTVGVLVGGTVVSTPQ